MVKRVIILIIMVMCVSLILGTALPVRAQASAGPLEQLLAKIPDNNVSRTAMWYGSLADFEQILKIQVKSADDFNKLPKSKQVAYLVDVSGEQVYYSPFTGLDSPMDWKSTFGVDSYTIERELTVGVAPNWYDVIRGQFTSKTITDKLQGLTYAPSKLGATTLYSLGADNAAATDALNKLAGSRYNRLIVSDTQIIAAPSTALIQASQPNPPLIIADPTYQFLVHTLESPSTLPNTTLISAALFDGAYLSDTVITADPLGASMGATLSGDQMQQLSNQLKLQNEKLLPRYQTVGFGYRRNADTRDWLLGLLYKDANSANQAEKILTDRLSRYGSFQQKGRQLFQGWQISGQIVASPDNSMQLVLVTLQLPAQTDVAWTQLITSRDIGFLATTH